MMAVPERIICAAILTLDGKVHQHQPINVETGFVVCGLRHHNCLATIKLMTSSMKLHRKHQGFLTSNDRFVDRIEAYRIAEAAQQLKQEKIGTSETLFSEDLY